MKLTPQQIYSELYTHVKRGYETFHGLSEDKASRKANIFAVQNTWRVFNEQKSDTYISSMEFY